ncbi:hypothetical protein [Haloterrigena gelatinilytica]|uniref:hypothetical protein n=1 Tax=Haloterrigena gelatinilytica TaxID=2741724 RepID=UPI0020C5DB6E|nr:hypothetical protein [Haloterrigena gelatinilytica]
MNDEHCTTEITPAQLRALLATIRQVDEQLLEPLTLNDSIAELEQTYDLYKRLASSNGGELGCGH